MKISVFGTSGSREREGKSSLFEVIGAKLRKVVMPLERRGAAWLSWQAERLSRGGKCVVLAVFILTGGGYSAYLVARGIAGRKVAAYVLSATTALRQAAGMHGENDNQARRLGPLLGKQEYWKIHRFTLYTDSLKASVAGKRTYDSLNMKRQGLMDSLRLVENLYQSQIKKQ